MSVDEASKVFKEKVIEEGPWNDEGDANNMWREDSNMRSKGYFRGA